MIVVFSLLLLSYLYIVRILQPITDKFQLKNNVSTVVFSFNYLLPICQRTFLPNSANLYCFSSIKTNVSK